MCDSIRFKNGKDIESVRQFQNTFNVDAKTYAFDKNECFKDIDCCMCEVDLDRFFKDHPEHEFEYDCGDWWGK